MMIQDLSSQHKIYEAPVPPNPARDELILEHLPQIKYIAQRISDSGIVAGYFDQPPRQLPCLLMPVHGNR